MDDRPGLLALLLWFPQVEERERCSKVGAGEMSPSSVWWRRVGFALILRWRVCGKCAWSSFRNVLNLSLSHRCLERFASKYRGADLARTSASAAPAKLMEVNQRDSKGEAD